MSILHKAIYILMQYLSKSPILSEIEEISLKCICNHTEPSITKAILRKKNKVEDLTFFLKSSFLVMLGKKSEVLKCPEIILPNVCFNSFSVVGLSVSQWPEGAFHIYSLDFCH